MARKHGKTPRERLVTADDVALEACKALVAPMDRGRGLERAVALARFAVAMKAG